MPALVRPAAAADIEQAYGRYEFQRDGLGDEFLAVLATALERIRRDPGAAPPLEGGVRRHLLRRFPCAVFYRTVGEDVVVVACLHPSRRHAEGPPRT